jgi:hypothetical protein
MEKFHRYSIFYVGIFISVLSVLANILFYELTKTLGEQYLIPITDSPITSEPMPLMMVILATFFPALLAILLYRVLNKFSPKAILPPFLSICVTAFLISLGGPLDLPGATIKTKLLLSSMHIIAGSIISGGLLIFHSKTRNTS